MLFLHWIAVLEWSLNPQNFCWKLEVNTALWYCITMTEVLVKRRRICHTAVMLQRQALPVLIFHLHTPNLANNNNSVGKLDSSICTCTAESFLPAQRWKNNWSIISTPDQLPCHSWPSLAVHMSVWSTQKLGIRPSKPSLNMVHVSSQCVEKAPPAF